MNLVVTHSTADFDALASLVLAGKIFPNSICLIPSFSSSVYSFFSLYGNLFENLKNLKDIDLEKIDRVIMVDTQYPERVTGLTEFIQNHKNILIIDHHYPDEEVKLNAKRITKEVGATTSILIHMLKNRKKFEIKPIEATLFALGIYEDTGNLLFITTKPYDIEALSYIFKYDVDLKIVSKYLITYLTEQQKYIFEKILSNLNVHEINGYKIGISKVKISEYTEGVGYLVHKVLELLDLEAVFSILIMDKKTVIIGRSRNEEINVKKILSLFGGGGHKTAAAANFNTVKKAKVYEKLIKTIKNNIKIKVLAKNIMSSPVKTIEENATLEDAKNLMLRFNYSGLPVVKNGKIKGIITRSEISKVELLGLTNLKVKDFMIEKFIFVTPETSLEEIEKIMVEKNIGRVPVVVKGRVVGIITRSDILRGLYLKNEETLSPIDQDKVKKLMQKIISKKIIKLLRKIGEISNKLKIRSYVVGGFVRDLFLNKETKDIDIVVEGDSLVLAQEIKKNMNVNIQIFQDFKTCKIVFNDELKIDIASSRREYYKEPASLPKVELSSSLREDLSRRDFTINTLAISINKDTFGKLIDLLGGYKDLKDKKIRVLHKLSFIDDPSRILRAIRYSSKLKFKIEKETKDLIISTIKTGLFTDARNTRIKEELFMILKDEESLIIGLKLIKKLGVLRMIHRKLELKKETFELIQKSQNLINELIEKGENIKRDEANFFLLISELNSFNRRELIERWNLKRNFIKDEDYYLNVVKSLEEAKSNYEIYNVLKNLSIYELIYLTKFENIKDKVIKYLFILKNIQLKIRGKDLIKIGFKPSIEFRDILEEIKKEVFEGNLKTYEDEVNYAKKIFEMKGEKVC